MLGLHSLPASPTTFYWLLMVFIRSLLAEQKLSVLYTFYNHVTVVKFNQF